MLLFLLIVLLLVILGNILLEASDSFADGGFDFPLRLHGNPNKLGRQAGGSQATTRAATDPGLAPRQS